MAFYPTDEQETVIVYESFSKSYKIFTSVPKHIRRLQKKSSMFEILRMDEDGEGNCIALTLVGKKLPPASTFN